MKIFITVLFSSLLVGCVPLNHRGWSPADSVDLYRIQEKQKEEFKELELGYHREWDSKLKIGMTPEEVLPIIKVTNDPIQKNLMVGATGRQEQWVCPFGLYLYFKDSKLEGWQL